MAKNSVIIKLNPSRITRKTGTHLKNAAGGFEYRCGIYINLPSTSSESSKQATSDFIIPLDLPSNCEITNIKIPIEQYNTSVNEGSSYVLVVDNVQYSIDTDGNLIDRSIIEKINLHKSQHGIFPELIFRIGSWVYRSSNYTATAQVILYAPAITCNINGTQSVHRPVSDITVGHSIPSGFSKIYDLIDESSSDESVTCISSTSNIQSSIVDQTSSVKMSPLHKNPAVYQMRLLASICMTEEDLSCRAETEIIISINGKSVIFSQKKTSGFERWKKNQYYTFEGLITSDSLLIKEINTYYNQYESMPEIQISLRTYAAGYMKDEKSTAYRAVAEISQVYLEVVYVYGMNIFKKLNGQYKEAIAGYKKLNGQWVEINEYACKEMLKSNNILTD